MVTSSVRSCALLALVLVAAVHAAPQMKFPFTKGRAAQPEPEQATPGPEQAPPGDSSAERETPSKAMLEQMQNEAAQYSYDTSVNDTINDHAIQRQEERNGLALKGMYSYSDGFFRRTVHYEADEKGYRVVKEINIPIGNGPQIDPNGKADVSSSLTGSYSITADDIAKPQRKGVSVEEEEEEEESSEGTADNSTGQKRAEDEGDVEEEESAEHQKRN